MKRQLLIVFIIVAIFGLLGVHSKSIDQRPSQVIMIEKAMQSVVKVVYLEEPEYLASGAYLGNGIVLTAGHVSGVEEITEVEFEDGTRCEILERIAHPDYDCGFLIIEPVDKPALLFDIVLAPRGTNIFVLGNPKDMTFIVTSGIVTGQEDCDGFFGDVMLLTIDAVIHGGNSGSAVLDIEGEIRGVLVGGQSSNCGSNLHGYEVIVGTQDILIALEAAGLEI